MALIHWSDEMSVGEPKIDEDHMVLVSLVRYLHHSVEEGEGQEVVGDMIETLVKFTLVHFRREEEMFENTDYPEIESHKVMHRKLIEKVKDFQQRYKDGDLTIPPKLLEFMEKTLITHMTGVDKGYMPYITAQE